MYKLCFTVKTVKSRFKKLSNLKIGIQQRRLLYLYRRSAKENKLKIAYILHTLYGKLGAIRDWAIQNQHELTKIHLFDNSPSPSPQDYDLLISMGGPQRLTSGVIHDYLLKEIEIIKQFIAHDKQVIGVCLGAQLISHAMGATTEYSPIKEIGLHEIIFNEKGKAHPIFSRLESPITTMHWHFDMPGLPPQAEY